MIRWALNHTRTMMMALVLLLVAGAYSYVAIPKESSPDVPIPVIYISVTLDGIAPEDAVAQLLKPLEQEMRGLEGLDEMEGTAFEGGANLVLRFVAGFDNDQALLDVREKVDLARPEFPDAADEPKVSEVNISLFPILTVILSGALPEREFKAIAEDLQDRIESVGSVLEAQLGGVREEQVLIEVDRTKLESFDLNPSALVQLINNNNRLVAAGSLELEQGRYAVKIPGLFETRDDLLNLPLVVDGDRTVRIRDIATVKRAFKDHTRLTRVDGKPAVTLEVSKRIGENIIETVDKVKAIVRAESENWPEQLSYSFTNDESTKIRNRLNDLQNNVATAVILVMVVVLAALGIQSASLVALTVPGSFLTAVMLLFAFGFTTNVVVLFALILSVGLLVDGAIVVTELADVKLRQGKRRIEAFTEAAQTMALPIIASTATTLAAFLPLLFWPDTVGEFMKFMPLTLIFTLSASLVMALLFLPTMGAALPRPATTRGAENPPFYVKPYENFLALALRHPLKMLGGVFWVFALVMMAYIQFGQGIEFFPRIEPERARLQVHAKGDLSIQQKDKIMQEVEQRLADLPGVTMQYVAVGDVGSRQEGPSDKIGTISMEYADWDTGRPPSAQILNEALARVEDLYGIRVERQEDRDGPSSGKPIKIAVSAPRFDMLEPIVTDIRQRLEDMPGTRNVDDNLPEPGIEWTLDIDREEANRMGTNLAEIGTTVRLATNGAIVGDFRPEELDEEIDIVARFADGKRSLDVIENLKISTPQGHIPLSHFMAQKPQPKVTVIRRLDQRPTAFVEADIAEGTLANDVVQNLDAEIEQELANLPRGVNITFKGENEDQAESAAFLQKAFAAAIAIMAIILVTQFNSFYQALVILTAVVLSTAGVLLGHLVMGKPFSVVMSGLGVIALAGIVVNNNIVLLDTYNTLRKKHDWHTALMETGKSRLRPVLLTAITTMIGLLPMALKINLDLINRSYVYNAPSTQFWDQLASAIIFGLAFATLLTLIVTPCMMALLERRKPRPQ